jgi:hypothetical protein
MNKRPVIWIIFLFFLCTAVSLNAESISKEKKDPILAGALSWYVPGLGQIYSGAYLKGIAFFVVEESLFIGTLLSFFELQLDVTGGIDLGYSPRSLVHRCSLF